MSEPALRYLFKQRAHAGAIVIVPSILTALAVYRMLRGEVSLWEPSLALAGYFLTMLGITVGFHRLLAHRAFVTAAWIRFALLALGSMAMQGAPIYWVSNHRRHHGHADAAGDPHSPHFDSGPIRGRWRGFWHAHFAWMFTHELSHSTTVAKDLYRDRVVVLVNQHYLFWVMLGLLLPALAGVLLQGSVRGALGGFVWGAGVRLFISFHMTACINSVTHLFGYRSFATRDQSRNNPWLGLPTLGEAWHNNHHAAPAHAMFGVRWWEIDIGGLFVRLLQRLGLANKVRGSLQLEQHGS